MNGAQNKIMHALLGKLQYGANEKMMLVAAFSNDRTSTSKELTDMEAIHLIRHLNNLVTGEKQHENTPINTPDNKREEWLKGANMRNAVKYYARQMNWDRGISDADFYAKIDGFCLKYCPIKKALNKYRAEELNEVVTIFKNMYDKELKKHEQTGAKQAETRQENV